MRGMSLLVVVGCLFCSSCGDQGSGSFATDASASVDTYIALDLQTGTFVPAGSNAAVVEADQQHRTTRILFRRIPAGSGVIGCEGNLSQPGEKNLNTVSYSEYFCAVFELTQRQWQLLTGTTPWTSALYQDAFTDRSTLTGDTFPAWGMSYDQAAVAATSWSRNGWTVGLPSSVEWEIACRAGQANKLFSWGNSRVVTFASHRAIFWEATTPPSMSDPLPQVLSTDRQPNNWRLFDMIGNVWEYAAPATGTEVELRGGAFDQSLVVCRASNVVSVPPDLGSPTAGVRLVLHRTGP